jgi:uncharacterized ion transporter superfamily protein YfcC
MDTQMSVYISRKAFYQSAAILFVLMIFAGVLTLVLPAGEYARVVVEGREVIDPGSFGYVESPDFPIWRWFTAPIEVLGGPDGLTIIVIASFVLFVAVSFSILDNTGIVRALIASVVTRFQDRKYLLLSLVSLVFMLLGASFGIFEEIVPLVPLMVALSYSLGWDALIGLGMSILAVNLGFSAALANPFTIGVAQRIAELPLFSGILFRIPIFLAVYLVLIWFLVRYAKRIEAKPERSLVHDQDHSLRRSFLDWQELDQGVPKLRRAAWGFSIFLLLILVFLMIVPIVEGLSDYVLPFVGILFFCGGVLAGILAGARFKQVLKIAWSGTMGILPALPLILMAASIKYIVQKGAILDTILHGAAVALQATSPAIAILLMLLVTLILEIFISSASAKAFLMMPILVPLADLAGVTRQATVLAYAFGDGFSNLAYPTNPVLLIALGLTVVSYPTWMRWTARVWQGVLIIAVLSLILAVAIGYGPF